jgi:hypothetical protein
LLAAPLAAQTETGQITGTVTDPTGAVVPNARVTVTAIGRGTARHSQTNSEGIYLVPNLFAGDYRVKVEATGFSTAVATVTVVVGSRAEMNFRLDVGRTETVIQVAESAALVDTETQSIATTVTGRQIIDLPTLTRNPYALVAISGSVSPDAPDGRGTGYAINGQRAASTNVLLDGAANNDEFTATVGQNIPLDSVQEFNLLTNNFAPEYGRASGGVVNLTTKSGANDLHGTAYWFNRVSRLASNDFDNNANGLDKPVYTRNQPGYSVGGPVVKNKLFFFQSTEWIRIRSAGIRNVYVPTPELIARTPANVREVFSRWGTLREGMVPQGTFTKSDLIGRGFNPCAGGAANGPCNLLPNNVPIFSRYSYSYPSDSGGGDPQNTHFGVARVDYNINSQTQLYGRFAWERIAGLVGSNADSPYKGFDAGYDVKNYNALVSLVRTLSPTVVSQSKLVFNRLGNFQPLGETPPTPTLYLSSELTATRILGQLVAFPGYLPFSPGNAIPFGGPQNFVQGYEDFSILKGRHNFRMGGSYTYLRDNRTFGAYQNPVQQVGRNFGSGMDNLLNGELYRFQSAVDPQGKYPCAGAPAPSCMVNLPVGQPSFSRSNRYHEFALYFNDSWKATPRLTLNLGVRYEYFGVQHNKNPYLDSNFYPAQGGTEVLQIARGDVTLAPTSYAGGLWRPDYNNFSPRLGFAWDVFGSGKTSLRGGYSMAYERNFGNVTFNVIQNPPNYAVISIFGQGQDVPRIPITTELAGPLAGTSGSLPIPRTSLRAVNPEIRTAYAHLWNLVLEHEVLPKLVVAAEYTGSKGSKLYSLENPNKAGAGNLFLGIPCTLGSGPGGFGNCTARLLSGGYTNINMRNGKGFSIYNAGNLRVRYTEFSRLGLTLLANYTWGHAIDNLSDTFSSSSNQYNLGLTDPFAPKLDRGDAYFDNRHRVAMSAVWDIPFARNLNNKAKYFLNGWQIAPIFTARTGAPYTMFDSTNVYLHTYPRAMFSGPAPKMNNVPLTPTAVPNVNVWVDLTRLPIDHSWYNPLINTSDFGPYPATMSGRNVFRTPGAYNIDFGLYKTTKIGERVSAQLRLETYNTLNHANLSVNTGDVDVGGGIDQITASRFGNRNVQLALKLIF